MLAFPIRLFDIRLGLASSLLVALAGIAAAQGTASLRGRVTDQQEAVVAGATVTLTDTSTGLVRTMKTQGNGDYQFLQLPPATYTLTVEMAGFSPHKLEKLELLVDTPSTVNVPLVVATSTAVIEVESEAPQLNAVNASVGNTFEEIKVQTLPIQTRNVVELLSLQPGVTQRGEVMGARRDQNNVSLDGIDSNDNQNALSGLNGTDSNVGFNSALPVPLDSVMEFRVTVAGQGAAQGRSSGGQVSLVTRSGTNALHGSAYEFNRNTAFTANTFFNNLSGLPRPQLVRNQFGASLGGPVKKNRLFYFLNYERRKDASQQASTATVPSSALKQGIVTVGLTNGTTYPLTPQAIKQIDPLGLGVNSAMLSLLGKYPAGNAPSLGADQGLNFSGLRFNAPVSLDLRVYVSKFDWIVDSHGRHTVSFRGTISNQGQTRTAAPFPAQPAASQLLADNRGFGTRYTALLSPSLVNVANIGLTRIGYGYTGTSGFGLTLEDLTSLSNFGARARNRINPTWNVTDDLTWTKGTHTIEGGFNFRFIDNRISDFLNSWPTYSGLHLDLQGLGSDIDASVLSYIQSATGNSGLKLSNANAVTAAMQATLGVFNLLTGTYQYQKSGSALAFGQPLTTDFISHTYELYAQDTWKVRRNLTLTLGVRYSYFAPPYEATGLQVSSTTPLNQFFADRVFAQDHGIPNNQLPNAYLSYNLNGPVNGKSSWFRPDKNNFAPRVSFAYTPNGEGIFKWMGKNTVIRGGAAVTYDQYGNDLVNQFSSLGSVGLSTTFGFPDNYNFATSPRISADGSLPAVPTAKPGSFPATPGPNTSISQTVFGISPDLVAPYSYLLNMSVSHQFSHGLTLDVGYAGRLSHKLLIQQDVMSPLIYFKDPKSGMTWVQADTQMRQISDRGVDPDQVAANPSLVPINPFVENMFPKLANRYFPGSASANYFYGIYGIFGGSDLDNLSSLDRSRYPNCIVATGCFTFFSPQASADPTWVNAGKSSYHGMIVTLRRALSNGFAFDLNYTWSHGIDNGSAAADGAGQFGGILQNAFRPDQFRGSSDFDLRHQVNANFLYDLPFGKGKRLLNSSGWLDQIVGGWQLSSLLRFRTGLPSSISGNGIYTTNYWASSLVIPNGPPPATGVCNDADGVPNIFCVKNPTSYYQEQYPGQTGTRAIIRLPGVKNVDMAVAKSFRMPWEGHSLTFRAEAFNLFNFVNFNFSNAGGADGTGTGVLSGGPLSLSQPDLFGKFTNTAPPRVLQLALRYSF